MPFNVMYSYDDEFIKIINSADEKFLELEGISKKQLDINKFSKNFFKSNNVSDISVDANANIKNKNVTSYKNEVFKAHEKLNSLYLLWKEMRKLFTKIDADLAIKYELVGFLYINDLTGVNFPYCYNFSTMDVATRGMPYLEFPDIQRPKNLISFIDHMVHFSVYASNSVMGAVGLADLLIVTSWFYEKLVEENVKSGDFNSFGSAVNNAQKILKQKLQGFIYNCNLPFRGGVQSGFYNVSVYDDKFLNKLVPEYIFEDGTSPDITTVKMVQNIYLDLINDILSKTPITFPVNTACFVTDEKRNIDAEFLNLISEKNLKYGNLNIYAGKSSTLSSCCRLRSSSDDKQFFNLFGSGSTKIGSLGVVTINLPRILFIDPDNWMFTLDEVVDSALKINHAKRSIIKKNIDAGMLPLYTHHFMEVNTQYSTIGLVGINEAIGYSGRMMMRDEGIKLTNNILAAITKQCQIWQKNKEYPVNIEQVPGETSSIKLAQKDAYYFNDNPKFKPCEFYSNQFIPLLENCDLLDRIKIQGEFDSKMSGGAILHLNIAEVVTNEEADKDLIKHTIKQGVIYFAENRNLQRCKNKHLTVGLNKTCPVCGKEITDNYTRVVGFLTNTKNWAKERREKDYKNRVWYKMEGN